MLIIELSEDYVNIKPVRKLRDDLKSLLCMSFQQILMIDSL